VLLKFAAGTTVINLMTALAALLRGKLAAVILGTAGVGLYGQVDSFYRGLVQICILSTGAGVTRCVAELHGAQDAAGIRRAFWSITAFSLALSLLVAILVVIGSKNLSSLVIGDRHYALFLSAVAFGLPLQALSDIIMGMLIGLRDLRAQFSITAAYTGGGLLLYTFLIFRFGLAGAVYSVLAIAACTCSISIFFLWKRRGTELRLVSGEKHLDLRLLRFILAIGFTGGLMAIADRLVVLAFRTILIRHFGLEANGLYQAVYSLSQLTIALAFGFVSTYLVPTLSGSQDRDRTHFEFSSALRLTLLIATLCSAVTVVYGKFVILATYSAAFLSAVPLLRYQAFGDFFRALTLLLAATIFSVHGWKPWFAIGMSFYVQYVLFFALLLPFFGLKAISIAYLLGYCTTCALAVCLFPRYTKMSFFTGREGLLLRSMALLLVGTLLVWLGNVNVHLTYTLGAAAILVWAKFAFTSSEYRRFWIYVSAPVMLFSSGER
jgi:O-antigen/teichoic acid export membrane protein